MPVVLDKVLEGTGWAVSDLALQVRPGEAVQGTLADAVAWIRGGSREQVLLIEVVANLRPSVVRNAALRVRHYAQTWGSRRAPSVAVFLPRVKPSLQAVLKELDVGYLDLFGGCLLRWEGLYIERPSGRDSVTPFEDMGIVEPRGERRGQDTGAAVFGPRAIKGPRVLRVMLSYPGRRWHQQQLAREAGVSVFTAHTVVRFLLREAYADYEGRGPEKVVYLVRPGELLEAWEKVWQEQWKELHSQASLYSCLARNVDEVRERLVKAAKAAGCRLGFTLAAGANFFGPYLMDDVVHAYIVGPLAPLAEAAELEEVPAGANVILYHPRDPEILYLPEQACLSAGLGRVQKQVAAPVCPVQLYLDMRAAGGRYAGEARRLREEVLRY